MEGQGVTNVCPYLEEKKGIFDRRSMLFSGDLHHAPSSFIKSLSS